jgi:hypothetical protein
LQGIWTKHVQYYLDMADDPERTKKYSEFLGSQSSAALHYGMNNGGVIGSVWYEPTKVRAFLCVHHACLLTCFNLLVVVGALIRVAHSSALRPIPAGWRPILRLQSMGHVEL